MVKIDSKICIGCGACVSICPKVFEMKSGKARVKTQKNENCIKEAIQSCPVSAISE
jgi:ferredoxin